MFRQLRNAIQLYLVCLLCAGGLSAFTGPFDGKTFKGRIAWSADGNFNDEDDWAASPIALAIFAEFGMQQKLTHFDYNCVLPKTDPAWEKQHALSVLGAAERFGYSKSVFIDCRQDLDGAIRSIAAAINASSAENPLYYVLAGPMEVPFLGIQQSDPEKRKYVYCISHNNWNDGYASGDLVKHNKRDVIPMGITWIQITDQNPLLSTSRFGYPSKPEDWAPWSWMMNSNDPNVRFLYDRMQAFDRADCSDAGMAWFLMTGNEQPTITDLKTLLEVHRVPAPATYRKTIRLEAENFLTLDRCDVEFYKKDRAISQRLCVTHVGDGDGHLQTHLNEPYSASAGRYDVDVRYFDGQGGTSRYEFLVNNIPKGVPWQASADDQSWKNMRLYDVVLKDGDAIELHIRGDQQDSGKLDYVQLNYRGAASPGGNSPMERVSPDAKLDDPAALPGQVIVAGSNPGYLKYNGGGPVFLSGPDNPEDFLYRGALNPDGTRSGGDQIEIINRLAAAGVNAFHCLIFRMRRCNYKDEGDDQHCPFVDCDPVKPLNNKMLDQWEEWLTLLEAKGIILDFEFYNDATDVETMGWTLDAGGNLHPDEQRFIEGIVTRFKHHKNILWSIEESANKLPAARTPHFKKIGALIAQTDNHHHPIIQSFVVPNDPDGDFHKDGVTTDAYIGDPNIRVVTWLHVVPHGDDFEAQHQEYLQYYRLSAEHFVVMKNETFLHPRAGKNSRVYMWSCALAGLHSIEAYHNADRPKDTPVLRDDGLINAFMEQTDFYRMQPHDELASGSAKWALANSGVSYIVYTYQYTGPMGLKHMTAGTYDLLWYDTVTGESHRQDSMRVQTGENFWNKPESMSEEAVLYIKRR